MSVKDPAVQMEVRALLGIPADEPIFILRGRDKAAESTVDDYEYNAMEVNATSEFQALVRAKGQEFSDFADANPERMKVPD